MRREVVVRAVAACVRQRHIALAAFKGTELIELRRHVRRADRPRQRPYIDRLETFASEHGASMFIVEAESGLIRPLTERGHSFRALSVAEASELLLGGGEKRTTRAELFRHLIDANPRLARFVTIFPATGEIAMSDRVRTLMLLVVALGLAALRDPVPVPQITLPI